METTSQRGPEQQRHQSAQQTGQQCATGQGQSEAEQHSVAGVAKAMKDKAQEFASSAASRATDAWESTKHGAQRVASTVTDQTEETWNQVSALVARYPIATTLAAGGLCYLLFRTFG